MTNDVLTGFLIVVLIAVAILYGALKGEFKK